MQKYADDISILDDDNNIVPLADATITVYDAGTTDLASLFSDDGVTSTSNPITSNKDGSFEFYAANGHYDLLIEKSPYKPHHENDIILNDGSSDHTQGTDQGLDTGGLNAVTAAEVKGAVTNSHAPGSDNQVIPDQLSDLSDDETHRLVTDTEKSTWNGKTDLTTVKADTDIASTISLKHTQGTDQGLDTGGANAVTAAQAKAGYTHSGVAHAPSDAVSLATVKADSDIAGAISNSHSAVTVSAPISLSGQALSLVNDAAATITEIDTGALANSDTVIPTSKAVATAIAAGGGGTDDVARDNIVILAWKLAIANSLAIFRLEDGVVDEFEDESGIDTDNSENQEYNPAGGYYSTNQGKVIDHMEYASDALAQAAYVSSDGAALQSYSESTIKTQGLYSLKSVAAITDSLNKTLTRNLTNPIDLTAQNNVGYDLISTRTGSNIKLGLQQRYYPQDVNTKFLFHADGTTGDKPTHDETNKAITWGGTAQLSTAQYKFGTASLLLDGDSDYIYIADTVDLEPGAGDFTIDLWLYLTATGNNKWYSIFSQWNTSALGWLVAYTTDGSGNGTMNFYASTNGADAGTPNTWSTTFSINTWYHLALVRSGNTLSFYQDGTRNGDAQAFTKTIYAPTCAPMISGNWSSGSPSNFVPGYMDEIRFSKGIARWTDATFTVPAKAFNSTAVIETTPAISVADTFESKTWDISEIADADKNNIDGIILTVVNADAPNIFYLDNLTTKLQSVSLILISNGVEAEDEPESGRFLALIEPVDSITINTDIKGYISNDDGSNFDEVTLTDEGYFDSTKKILSGNVTLTDRSDKTMVQKLQTFNNKDLKVHAWGMLWS